MKSKDDKCSNIEFVKIWNDEFNLSPKEKHLLNRKISNTIEAEYLKFETLYKSGVKDWPVRKSLQTALWKKIHLIPAEQAFFANPNLAPEDKYNNFKITLYELSDNIKLHLQHNNFKSERAYLTHWLENLKPESKLTPEKDYRQYLIDCRDDCRDDPKKDKDAAYIRLKKDLYRYKSTTSK